MVGSIFKRDVAQATGTSWEQWLATLAREVDPLWSHEQIRTHIRDRHGADEEWSEWIALLYGQAIGRVPVGVTQDAGVQIGVRRTLPVAKERAWHDFTSLEGLARWIGRVPEFPLRAGYAFASAEGVSGKLTVVVPHSKLRLTWQRAEWDSPSRLQLYFLSTASGHTTIAIHQEMLEDVYMRETMRRFWDGVLQRYKKEVEEGAVT